MEAMLQAVIVVFMLFLCSLCLFAIVVIVRDIIHENAKTKRERERDELRDKLDSAQLSELIAMAAAAKAEVKEDVPAEDVPAEEEPQEVVTEPEAEPAPEAVEQTDEDENAVVFSRQSLTLEEKYATLSTEFKRHFDDIIKHALAKEGVRELKYGNYYDYKIGSYKVLRITIKRGEIVCEFQFLDRDFMNYANASNVKMKQSATSIRVTEPSAVGAVKDGIDLVVTQIAEDKEYKKNLAREKRREKRRKEREENNAVSPANENSREGDVVNA